MNAVGTIKKDMLTLSVFDSRASLGSEAAREVAARICTVLEQKPDINIVFASAPSQNEFLAALLADSTIPWDRINAFHMDEYIGLAAGAPQGFGNFIRDRLWGRVKLKSANYIDGNAVDLHSECVRYEHLLKENPIGIVCFGIGENGHLAFNDPQVASFTDPFMVKIVKLDAECRQQQVNDGCFRELRDVPTHAITVTIPAIMSGGFLFGMVPGSTKAKAILQTMNGPIDTGCPATILRNHPNAVIYADRESAACFQWDETQREAG